MRKPLPLDAVDLEMLASVIDSGDYDAAYFDPATGEVWQTLDGEVLGPDNEPLDLDEVDWISIGGSASHDAYEDMENFVEAVADGQIARRLSSALGGKGAFRRFRDEIHRQPEPVGRAWNSYRNAGQLLRAVAWLRDEGLVVEAEAEACATALRQDAERALEAVRTAAGPVETVSDDPVEILRLLPAELRAEFESEYANAVENARRPEGFADLVATIHRWGLQATAQAEPTPRSGPVRPGDAPVDELQRRRDRRR